LSDRNHRICILVVLVVFLQPLAGCGSSVSGTPGSEKLSAHENEDITIEDRVKEKALSESFDMGLARLTMVRHLEDKLGEGKPFVYPTSLALSEEGQIYISDNNAHKVYSYSPKTDSFNDLTLSNIGSSLSWPTIMRVKGENLFVLDTKGIKVFALDGSFRRLLKTFYQINDFVVRTERGFYLNPSFRKPKQSDPLVVGLSEEGTKIQSFGARLNREEHAGLEDVAWLCSTEDRIFVVFRYRPKAEIFSLAGELIQSFDINHAIFKELIPISEIREYTNPGPGKYRLPGFVAGACVIGDRLLVLLDLPQPEIIEFNFAGIETNRYRGNVSPAAKAYHGFDARLVGDKYQFWMLVRSRTSLLTLWECSGQKTK